MSKYIGVKATMQKLAKQNVDQLTSIWEQLYTPEDYRKQIERVANIYGECVVESLLHKKKLEKEINDLKKEAENLKTMLNTDIQLPSYENKKEPLQKVKFDLEKCLETLRDNLRNREEERRELLRQQEVLCKELGELPRDLSDDPLPTDEDIKNFCKHLESLTSKRSERESIATLMRSEIKNCLQILDLNVNTESEKRLLSCQNRLDKDTFDGLQRMLDLYSGKVKELDDTMDGMRNKLETLFDRLNIPPYDRIILTFYDGCYNKHIFADFFHSELQRCETLLKNQNMH